MKAKGRAFRRAGALVLVLALLVSVCSLATWDGHVCDDPDCCAICRFAGLRRQLSCSDLPAPLAALGLVILSIAGILRATPRLDAGTLVSRRVQLND